VFLLILSLSIILFYSLSRHNTVDLRGKISVEAKALAAGIDNDLKDKISYLRNILKTGQTPGGYVNAVFSAEAASFIEKKEGIVRIGWADRNLIIRSLSAAGNDEPIRGQVLEKNLRTAMAEAKKTGGDILSSPVDSGDGTTEVYLILPVLRSGVFEGCAVAMLDFRLWMDHVISLDRHHDFRKNFSAAVILDRAASFTQDGWNSCKGSAYESGSGVSLMGHDLTVMLRPLPLFTSGSRNPFPIFILISGVILAALAAVAIQLGKKTIIITKEETAARASLEKEVHAHLKAENDLAFERSRFELAVKAGGIGIWSMDIQSRVLDTDDAIRTFFNIPSGTKITYDEIRKKIHREDLPAIDSILDNIKNSSDPVAADIRISAADGTIRFLSISAKKETAPDGSQRLMGIVRDSTALKNAEQSLQRKSDMQKLLMEISLKNINISTDSMADSIQAALEQIGEFVAADRAYIFDYDIVNNHAINIFEWCSEGIESQIDALQNVSIFQAPGWFETHREGKPIIIPNISELPPGNIRTILEVLDIRSIITVPMMYGSEVQGFAGFDYVKRLHSPTQDEADLLSLFAQIIVNIRKRVESETELIKSEMQVRLMIESTAEAIYGIDMQGKCTFANKSCCALLGYSSKEELLGRNMHDLIHHSYPDGNRMESRECRIFKAFRSGKGEHVDNEVMWRADGTSFPVEYWSYPQMENGRVTGAVVAFNDISDRKAAKELLIRARNRLENIIEGTHAGTWEWNVQTDEIACNTLWAEMLGYTLGELLPINLETWMDMLHPEDVEKVREQLNNHLKGNSDFYECELRMRHKKGNWIWILARGKISEKSSDGRPFIMSGTNLDITARKHAEETIRHMATHDGLTDLPSLRLAKDRLVMAVNTAKRNRDRAAVMFIDLDGFKEVNDTFGHDAGNDVLREVAARLRQSIRETDTAARVGGDEFMLVLSEIKTKENASEIAEKLLDHLSKPVITSGNSARVGASIGIAFFPDDSDDPDSLIKLADEAMYEVKKSGKNRYKFV
jgi:diguanylate cyclase (GGDEF)-like protein/PAS domain S-box-containing protein